MNTEIIAFASAAGVFRKKTPENQRKAWDELSEDFAAEFDRDPTDDDWQMLLAYQAEKAEAKRKREAAKLERDAAKAAKLAAMPVSASQEAGDHIDAFPAGRYILTVAQNNTDVDADFLAALERYAERHDAKILVAQTVYNKKAFRQVSLDDMGSGDPEANIWFDPAIKRYIVRGTIDLHGAHFLADANVIVTAQWPTQGFDGNTPPGVHAIVPTSKIELRVGAALKGAKTKTIVGTGAVTKRNYIVRGRGAKASAAHCIGAVFVDTVTNEMRHLHKLDGQAGFYDIDGFYSANAFTPLMSGDVAALQFGDIHAEKMEQANLDRACEMILNFKPSNVILHDVLDFSSRNHHNIKDPTFLHEQFVKGNTVRGDLQKLADVLDAIAETTFRHDGQIHIVESNHDLAINTWLKNADFKIDPINALVYLDCMTALYRHKEEGNGDYFNMLQYAYEEIGEGGYSDQINFHETDESLVIAGVEMGNHGHNGVNGSRGSPKQFAALGVPMNTGHTHSPSIFYPCFTAGVTASLEMGYNIGASSWAIADTITYANGQRQIIFA